MLELKDFEKIKNHHSGLSFFQWEKYWQWFLETHQATYPYLSQENLYELWLKDQTEGKPLAHIIEQWGFYKDLFFVSPDVLIPRPETEILVDLALKHITRPMNILEIGVGSGAVLLSILLHSRYPLKALGTDICAKALCMCQKNFDAKALRLFNLHHHIQFKCTDRCKELPQKTFDLIVTNPPYIPSNHQGVTEQVRAFEPSKALFLAEEQYMPWMMTLIHGIYECLAPGGLTLIEGHEDYLEKIVQEIQQLPIHNHLKDLRLLKDLNQRDRFLQFSI